MDEDSIDRDYTISIGSGNGKGALKGQAAFAGARLRDPFIVLVHYGLEPAGNIPIRFTTTSQGFFIDRSGQKHAKQLDVKTSSAGAAFVRFEVPAQTGQGTITAQLSPTKTVTFDFTSIESPGTGNPGTGTPGTGTPGTGTPGTGTPISSEPNPPHQIVWQMPFVVANSKGQSSAKVALSDATVDTSAKAPSSGTIQVHPPSRPPENQSGAYFYMEGSQVAYRQFFPSFEWIEEVLDGSKTGQKTWGAKSIQKAPKPASTYASASDIPDWDTCERSGHLGAWMFSKNVEYTVIGAVDPEKPLEGKNKTKTTYRSFTDRFTKFRMIARSIGANTSTPEVTLPQGYKVTVIPHFRITDSSETPAKISDVFSDPLEIAIPPGGSISNEIDPSDIKGLDDYIPAATNTQVLLTLLPMEITGHRRGTFNAPGAVSAGGIYGKETVLLENADRDEGSATQRDLDTATLDKANDDDLVKVVLSFPANTKPAGIGLKLKHEGMKVDGTKTTFDSAVVREGASRLNFYDDQGNKLTDADLKIDDLANPGSGYMAGLVNNGTLTLFIEGADDFGMVGNDVTVPDNAKYMGGALLTLEMTGAGAAANSGPRLLVFRGGFMRYRHPNGQPGELGTLEFRDGKGRITNDNIDLGAVIKTWSARSGKPGGAAYNVSGGNGHIPPGWRLIYRRNDFEGPGQQNQQEGSGNNLVVKQGGYCRWTQDDNAPGYTTTYIYRANDANDQQIGKPAIPTATSNSGQTIMFKFQTEVIPPTDAANRTEIQFHPDGKKDGSAGCVSIQSYDDCKEVYRYLNDYKALKLKVDLE